MSRQFKQNKYNAGDIVSAKVNPTLKLIIRRYVDQVYYCKIQEYPKRDELVYFERELVEDPLLEAENKKSS
jgi:hypothetical protein